MVEDAPFASFVSSKGETIPFTITFLPIFLYLTFSASPSLKTLKFDISGKIHPLSFKLLFSEQKKSLYQRTSAKMPFVIDFSGRRKRIAV